MRARPLSGPALLAAFFATLAATLAAGPAAAADGSWRVSRERGDWVIEAHASPRDAVAQQLAALSGSTWALAAGPAPLADARPLTLRWRGRDLAGAWSAVLGGAVNHAVQCAPRGCRVWVLGPVADSPQAAAGVSRHLPPTAVRATAPVPAPTPAPTPAPAPVRDHGSHAPEPVAAPLSEDPPGLFPSS